MIDPIKAIELYVGWKIVKIYINLVGTAQAKLLMRKPKQVFHPQCLLRSLEVVEANPVTND